MPVVGVVISVVSLDINVVSVVTVVGVVSFVVVGTVVDSVVVVVGFVVVEIVVVVVVLGVDVVISLSQNVPEKFEPHWQRNVPSLAFTHLPCRHGLSVQVVGISQSKPRYLIAK